MKTCTGLTRRTTKGYITCFTFWLQSWVLLSANQTEIFHPFVLCPYTYWFKDKIISNVDWTDYFSSTVCKLQWSRGGANKLSKMTNIDTETRRRKMIGLHETKDAYWRYMVYVEVCSDIFPNGTRSVSSFWSNDDFSVSVGFSESSRTSLQFWGYLFHSLCYFRFS